MKIAILTLISGLMLSAMANATQLQCEYAKPAPGNPTYLLVYQDKMPGENAQGVILSQTLGTGSLAFKLVAGQTEVSITPDGGPLIIASVDSERIDWNNPNIKGSCFLPRPDQYTFRLSERTTGIKGTVTITRVMDRNPNPGAHPCPNIVPGVPATYDIVCKQF